jgi:hypothetical protein
MTALHFKFWRWRQYKSPERQQQAYSLQLTLQPPK